MPSQEFAGRHVLITGGSRGIGLATARAFLESGARVTIGARDALRLTAARQALEGLGAVAAVVVDVRERSQCAELVSQAGRGFGAVDVLVNNAGVAWSGAFAEQDAASLDAAIDVNLKGVLYCTREVVPGMLQRGRGVVINVSSGAGLTGFAGLSVYCASKFAVVGFTESLAAELADSGVRVHALCPGAVATDMQRAVSGRAAGMDPTKAAAAILALAGARPPAPPGVCLPLPY